MNNIQILRERKSIRSYTEEQLPLDIVKKLKAEITMTNTHQQGFRFQLITNDPDPMKGVSRSYGAFKNAHNYLAAVVDMATPHICERAGYFAEKFAIRATELGLGTCFVGSTFNNKEVKAQIRAGEKILFLVLVGFAAEREKRLARIMTGFMHRKKRNPESFFIPEENLPDATSIYPDLKIGLEAVSCAPSALNRQPVRITLGHEEGRDVPCAIVKEETQQNLIDLGIAKYNYNFATSTECQWG
ncbi:MAG: hypothetical protein K2K58_07880, partial [Muribaculaceae bacterium]|nr:hypothetical protein [Muribaculaceae bacterium]